MAQQAEKGEHRNLYPPLEPYDSGFLKVSDLHTLYYEQSGIETGNPVIFV
jgi:proline iminopeptidase